MANNMNPDQTAPFRSSLIRVQSSAFMTKEVHLNIYSRRKKQTFSEQKNTGGTKV